MVNRKVAWRKNALKNSIHLTSRGEVLGKMGAEQIREVLLAFLAAHLYLKKALQICEYFFSVFCNNAVAVALVTSRVPIITSQRCPSLQYKNISVSESFQVLLFFHAIGLMSTAVKNRSLRIVERYSNSTLISICVPLVTKAWCVQLWKQADQGCEILLPIHVVLEYKR